MTLTQYLKQKNPIRMPNVILKNTELIIASTQKLINGEVRKRVYFKTENSLLAGTEYCLIGSRLYTTDSDGNPKNQSCFRLENK